MNILKLKKQFPDDPSCIQYFWQKSEKLYPKNTRIKPTIVFTQELCSSVRNVNFGLA